MLNVQYGNREGAGFSEHLFDFLRDMLGRLHLGPSPGQSEVVEVQDPRIWYDRETDFHCLSFVSRGKTVSARVYRVLSAAIDGDSGNWPMCPIEQSSSYVHYLRSRLGARRESDSTSV